jgi:excinuclease ABC subunit A
MPYETIELQGVRVHNLQNIDLQLPLRKLIAVGGVSGSGKSSLAFDTLYAEGQRRYIETFSPYARQFFNRLEKPDADRIDHLPPAIAIRQNAASRSARSTIATATEIHDYLRLLFAKIGVVVCPECNAEIRRDTPPSILDAVQRFPTEARFQIGFPLTTADGLEEALAGLRESGFSRLIVGDRMVTLDKAAETVPADLSQLWVVVDRLTAGKSADERVADSLELAFRYGDDRCLILVEESGGGNRGPQSSAQPPDDAGRGNDGDGPQLSSNEQSGPHSADSANGVPLETVSIDRRSWRVYRFNARLVCETCQREFLPPEPRLFSFNAPLGACPECRGFGAVSAISFDKLVPDPTKSLREGAIAAWTTPAYRHELDELLALADDYHLPVDVPFSELSDEHRNLIRDGVPERNFGGLEGFFRWLERHKYKLGVRVFLNRWRTYETCPACNGDRLQPLALAVRIGDRNITDVCRLSISEAAEFVRQFPESHGKPSAVGGQQSAGDDRQSDGMGAVTSTILVELQARIEYLLEAGLGYLTLDRAMNTLSGGESQRVALTAALGSSLVNTLYVLDEPSAGLHPRDSGRVIAAIQRLQRAGNTVVVVEHEDAFVLAADEVVEIGPGAGKDGGRVIFQGTPAEMLDASESITGAYLSGRRRIEPSQSARRLDESGRRLRLEGARGNNLDNLTVEFPLEALCVVTGVSGSGKSTLVEETLYPALCRELRQPCAANRPARYDRLVGADAIDEVILVDQEPIGRSPRSNPVTYIKAFDEIRKTFAGTPDAKLRNFTAKHFSFNAAGGGRCPKCEGNGAIAIDMQFLPDVSMTCPECQGTRYRQEILKVKYRGLTIAEVLAMTVGEAFAFFRSQRKLQRQLNFLKQVGLDYLPLGQPANTLSGGESQRLKLASFLASGSRKRTLFLLDEPTTGLHRADIDTLLQCFESLLAVGHSLIVIEHNLDVMRRADWIIDLGPEAGAAGGRIVACGTPAEITAAEDSMTGQYLTL